MWHSEQLLKHSQSQCLAFPFSPNNHRPIKATKGSKGTHPLHWQHQHCIQPPSHPCPSLCMYVLPFQRSILYWEALSVCLLLLYALHFNKKRHGIPPPAIWTLLNLFSMLKFFTSVTQTGIHSYWLEDWWDDAWNHFASVTHFNGLAYLLSPISECFVLSFLTGKSYIQGNEVGESVKKLDCLTYNGFVTRKYLGISYFLFLMCDAFPTLLCSFYFLCIEKGY